MDPRLPAQASDPPAHHHARAYIGSVDTAAIQDDAVTAAKIAADAVGPTELANGSVDTGALIDGSVTAAKIFANTITAGQIADNAIGSGELADNAVDAAAIAAGAVTATKLSLPAVRAVWSANTLVNNDSVAAVAFGGTDEYDTDTMHNPVTNNTRLTCGTAGVFRAGGYYVMEPDADGSRGIYIQKTLSGGGSTIVSQKKITTAAFGGAPNDAMEISVEVKLAVGDYLELFAQNIGSGGNLNVTNGAFWASYVCPG